MTKREAVFTKDTENNKITVVRSFGAPLEEVWEAWTTSELLEQWWAPKPYKAKTKIMDFSEGGMWLYAMVSPADEKQWCRLEYNKIDTQKSIKSSTMFCDEDGNVNTDFPKMHFHNTFGQTGDEETTVITDIIFDNPEDMEAIIKMGFEEGFTMALGNLDEYLESK
jgi:uncharacterized protein YndB with AHSA1/START domain